MNIYHNAGFLFEVHNNLINTELKIILTKYKEPLDHVPSINIQHNYPT